MRRRLLPAVLFLLPSAALAQDADGDGVPNAADAQPCDPLSSGQAFAPAEGVHGTILVEDQWPMRGDLDTNDLVLGYNYAFDVDAAGRVRRLRLNLDVLAIGGTFDNGLGVHLPVSSGAVEQVTLTVGGGGATSLTPSAADAELTVVLQDNLRNLYGGATGAINSRPDADRRDAPPMLLEVTFSSPVALDVGAAPYDVFLFRTGDPSHEVHGVGYAGTARMNAGLFGTQDDGSTPSRRFVDRDGIPALLLLPDASPYPAEGVAISTLFPDISGFAASGGALNQDFYATNMQPAARYTDRNGQGAATAQTVTVAPVDTACVLLADSDGDGVTGANDCDDTNPAMFPGNPETCDGLDNDCDGSIDEGTTANFATWYRDADGDGFGDPNRSVPACGQPPGYVSGHGACTNGSTQDCNVAGTTRIPSSAFVDTAPPSGWRQCAGFVNTSGDDVDHNFLDHCLGATGLRIRVWNDATGELEEDVRATGLNSLSSWPNWAYLGGSVVAERRTYWGSTTFFTVTNGDDACRRQSAPSGTTFGTGNGTVAIVAGGNTNAYEYRVSCNGGPLVNRRVAIYVEDGTAQSVQFDCDDADANNHPNHAEVCDAQDNNCDGMIDEGLAVTWYRDADGDGYGVSTDTVSACSPPSGYVRAGGLCSNGSVSDCNLPGTTLISSSAYVDVSPPSGWVQCAGFTNTSGDDVQDTFLNECLGASDLRIIVRDANTDQVEEDITVTGLGTLNSWPNWAYLGGTASATTRTRWGTTTFFTATNGDDACRNSAAPNGVTFGTGNGNVAIVAGGNTNQFEYRVSCGGQALNNRHVAIYRSSAQPATTYDCDDTRSATFPGAAESCNGLDDDCDTQVDEGDPGGGASCSTGLSGVCGPGTVTCTAGALVCRANDALSVEVCGDGADNDCDGVTDEPMCAQAFCSNGSAVDCNVAGTTRISSSAFVDASPPSGWTQCAGFLNTSGDDVDHTFLNHCLGSNRLRIRVWNDATGQLEEDVYATGLNSSSNWPNWGYLGGSATILTRTYWGSTTFFTVTNGDDACRRQSAPNGITFGTGNGSVGIVAGGNTNAYEYRISCNGQALPNRRVAIYR